MSLCGTFSSCFCCGVLMPVAQPEPLNMCTMKQRTWKGSSTDRTQYSWSRLLKAGASRRSLVSLGLRSWGDHLDVPLTWGPNAGSCSGMLSEWLWCVYKLKEGGHFLPREQSAQRGNLTGRRPSACSWLWCPVIAGTVSQSWPTAPVPAPAVTQQKRSHPNFAGSAVFGRVGMPERISGKLTWISNSSANVV